MAISRDQPLFVGSWVQRVWHSDGSGDSSHTSHIGCPNMFVQLELKTRTEAVFQQPLCQLARIECPEHRTEEDWAAIGQMELSENVFCPFIIDAILNDEFDFISRSQPLHIGPVHAVRHTTPWAFHIQNDANGWIDGAGVDGTARFKKDRETVLTQSMQQGRRFRLCQGFASRHLDQGTPVRTDPPENVFEGLFCSSKECVLCVAPGAAKRAAGEAHKHAG